MRCVGQEQTDKITRISLVPFPEPCEDQVRPDPLNRHRFDLTAAWASRTAKLSQWRSPERIKRSNCPLASKRSNRPRVAITCWRAFLPLNFRKCPNCRLQSSSLAMRNLPSQSHRQMTQLGGASTPAPRERGLDGMALS
jgi:hypothetical protein